jgi:hypothetical protein
LRLIGEVLLMSGLVVGTAGCGERAMVPVAGGAISGVVLVDSETEEDFNLSVANGALTLTETGGLGTAPADAGLIDQTTGAHYSLGVTGGALTLDPSLPTTGGRSQIELSDTTTTNTYSLAVVGGELTLIPG